MVKPVASRRWRWSLRSLLLFVTVAALLVARWNERRLILRSLEEVDAVGGKLYFGWQNVDPLFGLDFHGDLPGNRPVPLAGFLLGTHDTIAVDSVILPSNVINEELITSLKRFKHLRIVVIAPRDNAPRFGKMLSARIGIASPSPGNTKIGVAPPIPVRDDKIGIAPPIPACDEPPLLHLDPTFWDQLEIETAKQRTARVEMLRQTLHGVTVEDCYGVTLLK